MADEGALDQAIAEADQAASEVHSPTLAEHVGSLFDAVFDANIRNTSFSQHTPTVNRITKAVAEIKAALGDCPKA